MQTIPQVELAYIEQFPEIPRPLRGRNWTKIAQSYARLVFSEETKGLDQPLLKITQLSQPTRGGYRGAVFNIPSYVGRNGQQAEALTCLGALVGGGLAGFDLTRFQGRNWVALADAYYTEINGHGLVLNQIDSAQTSGTFWYDIFPSCLYFHLDALNPSNSERRKKMRQIASSWLQAIPHLKHNFEHTGFDFYKMQPCDSDFWVEPDAAIGLAYLFYVSYVLWGDAEYLQASLDCMTEMANYPDNPYYEILGSYGPCLAARLNAEQSTDFPIEKFLSYVFDFSSAARPGWGIIQDRWGDYDAHGLAGSTTDSNGYAFAMNTFVTAGLIAPMVRYAPQYARSIAKWLLHVYVNSNLFFPDDLPPEMQRNHAWTQATGIENICYEGVRHQGKTVPYATGDQPGFFNPYGAWSVGFLGGLFTETNVPGILRIDLVRTEFHGPASYPTYLLHNPYNQRQLVEIDWENPGQDQAVDVFDLVSQHFITTKVRDRLRIELAPDQAAVLVILPGEFADEILEGCRVRNGVTYAYPVKSKDALQRIPLPTGHLAFAKPVRVSSALETAFSGKGAVDGDWGTAWQPAPNDRRPWISVDFESIQLVRRLKLRWKRDLHPASYVISISQDEKHWVELSKISGGSPGLNQIILSQPIEANYLKVSCIPKSSSRQCALVELEVY